MHFTETQNFWNGLGYMRLTDQGVIPPWQKQFRAGAGAGAGVVRAQLKSVRSALLQRH